MVDKYVKGLLDKGRTDEAANYLAAHPEICRPEASYDHHGRTLRRTPARRRDEEEHVPDLVDMFGKYDI